VEQGALLVGRYQLEKVIGRGGMAEVHRAHDLVLNRPVAVKQLLAHHDSDDQFRARFRQEAHAAASLNHPNITGVYDTGDHEGSPFIVMELVEGRSLQETIAAGGLTEDRALEVASYVCAALQYAHERNLIHRDIKPGNILLAEDGSVKVADFGIARAIDADTVTQTAAILGTAAYLSPEQAQGKQVDARSDLYSLGVVLYELLCGHQPFTGDSAITVAYQHVQELPTPLRELDPTVSTASEAIVMRTLAKNPANRYASATEMREDLQRARAGGGVHAPAVLPRSEAGALSAAPVPVAAHTGPQAPVDATTAIESLPEPVAERTSGARIFGYVMLAVLTVIAVATSVAFIADRFAATETTQLTVPPVEGQLQEAADEILSERGFDLRVRAQEASDTVPAGYVISQSPSAGVLADEGSTVEVLVSLGASTVTVPNVEGLDVDAAKTEIRAAGLVPGQVVPEPNEDVDVDVVLRTDPPADTSAAPNTPVDIFVSSGEETVLVRNVVGFTDADARFRLEDQQLTVSVFRVFSDTVPEGTVVSQTPEPGAEVPVGSQIVLEVSTGPSEPTEEPAPEPTDEPTDEPTANPTPTTPPTTTPSDSPLDST
jgi:beta-lactam-binding protein with PASTA domain/tRNA A-37 threonylcarbamoyl transferase component Bud32